MANEAKIVLSAVDQTKAAIDSAKRGLIGLGEQASMISGKFGQLSGAIAAVAAALKFKQSVDMLDALDDMAEKTGVNVETLSKLRYAAEVNSVSMEALSSGFKKLSKFIGEAASGNEKAIGTFQKLDVEFKNADGSIRGADKVLQDLAQRFSSWEDGPLKAAAAMTIFGKSGMDMIPLLNLGTAGLQANQYEASKLGAVYGGELAKQAADFNDNLKKIALASEGAALSISGPLIKALGELSQGFIDAKKNGENFFAMVARTSSALPKVPGMLSGLPGARFLEIWQQAGTALNAPKTTAQIQAEVNAMGAAAGAGRGFVNPKTSAPSLPGDPKPGVAPNNNAEKYISSLAKEMATLTKTTSKYDEVMEHIRINAKDFSPVQKAEALAKATEIDVEKRLGETIKNNVKYHVDEANAYAVQRDLVNEFVTSSNDATAAIIRQTSRIGLNTEELARLDAQEQVDVLMKKLMANATSETRQELETLAQTMRGNVATAMDAQIAKQKELTDNMVNGIQKAIKDYSDELKHVGTAAGQATTRILQSTEDALTQFFTTGKLNARSLIDTIIAEFMRLQVVRPLMASLFGGGGMLSPGMIGGALNDLKMSMNGGFGTGSSFGNLDLGGFLASGGSANGGTPYIVGERGPELFIPNSSGTVVPNNKMAGGASIVNTYNVNIDSRSDAASVYAGVRQMLAQHSRQQRDDLERMGVIAA